MRTPGDWFVNPTGDVGNWIVGNDEKFIADCSVDGNPNAEEDAVFIANSTRLLDAITDLAVNGCATDGGHRKQWYLFEILKLVEEPEKIAELKEEYGIDEGIAP